MTSYFLVNGYLREIGSHVRNMQHAVNELDDLVRFQQQELEIDERADAVALAPAAGEIRFERVRFAYKNQPEPIYDDFSLRIAAGERVGPGRALGQRQEHLRQAGATALRHRGGAAS